MEIVTMESQQFDYGDFHDGNKAPPLSSRPRLEDDDIGLISPSNLLRLSSPSTEPFLRRKPVVPRRSSHQFLEPRSYDSIQMSPIGASQPSLDHDDYDDEAKADLTLKAAPPKAFQKPHVLLFGWNLGRWRQLVRHFLIFCLLFLAIFLPLWYASGGFGTVEITDDPFFYDCTGSESGWSFVGINIRFGSFRYGTAKTIDIAWNWIVGRGLQGVLSFLAYRVFQDALLRITEMTPLPYELYVTLALYSTKVDILWQLSRGLLRFGNWRTKAIFAWLLISTIYLAIFPSLMDLCSGYDSAYTSNFLWANGSATNTDDLEDWYSPPSNVISNYTEQCCAWNDTLADNLQWNTTCFVSYEPGFCGHNTVYSNVTLIYYWLDSDLNTTYWDTFAANPGVIDQSRWKDWAFAPVDPNRFECIAQKYRYQWGFSFEWLFVAAVVNALWLFGLWIVWLDCDTNSELCKKGRRLGLWRAIADVSEALRDELGPNTCAYTEKELSQALKNRPPIKYSTSRRVQDGLRHVGLSPRPSGRLRLHWNQEYGSKTV